MEFNNNKSFAPSKKGVFIRIVSVILVFVLGGLLWIEIIPYSKEFISGMSTSETIASATLFITVATLVIKCSEKILQQSYTAKRKISIEVMTTLKYADITCRISNCSKKRIVPQNIYLMVEEGVMSNNVAKFPYLLKHEQGEFDCVFATLCKNGGFTQLPEHLVESEYKDKFRKIIRLKHLSSETIMFIDPGEEFSEDTVVELKSGIYRATVVWTSVKEDCICGTKEFIIE